MLIVEDLMHRYGLRLPANRFAMPSNVGSR
ncbi:hypothetical protein AFCDBAGC_3561 [Methylobacterium cerastii]|uniref:Uncharacterized protein n=1 Tax=Methylobacterium cerastii TaxID=932741 RepID=A0ABQ4QKW6_9HYPH|nr:hypothetical protein AFCDBAGC_3561 [Methylobacterium cerastii]